MQEQALNPDSGFEDHRVEFVREDEPGVVPDNPDWQLYSDTLETALNLESDTSIEPRRGLGNYTPERHFAGPEEHTATIEYDLQRFFVDGSGNPQDPAGDAMVRTNGDVTSHTIVDRADKGDSRTYTVARGAFPSLDSIDGDPGEAVPLVVSLEYEIRKARSYRVDQPAGEMLTVKSTDASDSTQSVTLESDGATQTETLTLDGTTGVSTTAQFDSIDAVWLDDDTVGDVIVEDSEGNELARLYGSDSYDAGSGDRGIPQTGDGSHADPIGNDYERFLEDELVESGSPIAAEIRSASLGVGVSYDRSAILGDTVHAIHAGEIELTLECTLAGEFEHHDSLTQHLRNATFDLEWKMSSGTITLSGCSLTDVGTVGPSTGSVVSSIDNTFSAESIDVSAN
jgi:hypothetical protein